MSDSPSIENLPNVISKAVDDLAAFHTAQSDRMRYDEDYIGCTTSGGYAMSDDPLVPDHPPCAACEAGERWGEDNGYLDFDDGDITACLDGWYTKKQLMHIASHLGDEPNG